MLGEVELHFLQHQLRVGAGTDLHSAPVSGSARAGRCRRCRGFCGLFHGGCGDQRIEIGGLATFSDQRNLSAQLGEFRHRGFAQSFGHGFADGLQPLMNLQHRLNTGLVAARQFVDQTRQAARIVRDFGFTAVAQGGRIAQRDAVRG